MNVTILIWIIAALLFPSQNKKEMKQANSETQIQEVKIIRKILADDGTFPNNEKLPLLIYKQAIAITSSDPASDVEKVFHENGWGSSWRNGIFSYHHYHSTAHEVLGVYSGWVNVQLGGEDGLIVKAKKGDVFIIPAGVAHKNLGASDDFRVVGAYPRGQSYDMNYGKKGERPQTDENIRNLAKPSTDPVFGKEDGLVNFWK